MEQGRRIEIERARKLTREEVQTVRDQYRGKNITHLCGEKMGVILSNFGVTFICKRCDTKYMEEIMGYAIERGLIKEGDDGWR